VNVELQGRVDGKWQGLGLPGHVPGEHQGGAEFAEGTRPGHGRTTNQPRACEWQGDLKEEAWRRSAQATSHRQQIAI
jgi:hypothetical protein